MWVGSVGLTWFLHFVQPTGLVGSVRILGHFLSMYADSEILLCHASRLFFMLTTNPEPKHVSFPAHGSSVVTCLIFSQGRIISASDDHSIRIYSPTGELVHLLEGHKGGVWALAASKDTLVSGSTDRTVRIWDLNTGRCTHVFGGHTSTVRCLAIVEPEWVDVEQESWVIVKEKWPKRPLIVTGSRDRSLRVWTLPRPGEPEYRCISSGDGDINPAEVVSCWSFCVKSS